MLWNLKFFRLEQLSNRNTKDENKNKKSHWKTSARTKANSGLLCWLLKSFYKFNVSFRCWSQDQATAKTLAKTNEGQRGKSTNAGEGEDIKMVLRINAECCLSRPNQSLDMQN
jgi:hypothetical protein